MKKNYYQHLNQMYVKYNRLVKNLQKSINNGRFATYAKEKQTQFLNVLKSYEAQLKKAGFVLGTSLALMVPPSTAYAQPAKLGNEIKVNAAPSEEIAHSTVAVDNDGDFTVTWVQYDTLTTYYDVYLQRYDNTGMAQGSEVKVNYNSIIYTSIPQIAMDDDGDFAVVWEGYNPVNTDYNVFVQRYDNNGTKQGNEVKVNTPTTTPAGSLYPAVAMDSDGDMVISWSALDPVTSTYSIYFQRFDATGTKQGTETRVNTISTKTISSNISMDDDGDFVVVWTGYDSVKGDYNVYMRRYDNNGAAQSNEIEVNTAKGYNYIFPSTAMDAHGDFVIVWTQEDQVTYDRSTQMQRYNPSGVAQGTQTQVGSNNSDQIMLSQGVKMDETGNFVVVWNVENGNYYDVYGQAYQSTGAKIGNEFLVKATANSSLFSSGLAMESDGDFIVSYFNTAASDDYYVYAQRYTGGLPTDVKQSILDSELTIYPNPVENELFLEANIQGIVKIYNLLGQSIKEISLNNPTVSINVSDLPTGQYLLELVNKKGQRATKKFIKQ